MSRRRSTLLTSALEHDIFPLNERRRYEGVMSERVANLPYYHRLPKDTVLLAKWRRYLRKRCATDKDFRFAVLQACEEDVLFFANSLCVLFEPRGKQARPVFLNTWADQDEHLVNLEECFGVRDCGVAKSRGIGMSWNMTILFWKHWYFDANCHSAVLSWDKSQLDTQDNPGTLMGKLDWLHAMMPAWIKRNRRGEVLYRTYGDHRFLNQSNGSTIVGHTGTDDVLSGDRKAAIFFDEVAKFQANVQDALIAMQGVTPCRYFVSTMRPGSPRFYNLMNKEESNMLRIEAYWWDNPERSKGKYKVVRGRVIHLDKEFDWDKHYPNGYKFNHPFPQENLERSPWVDGELRRAGNKNIDSMLVELYGQLVMDSGKLFQEEALAQADACVRRPLAVGNLDFLDGHFKPLWNPDPLGKLLVWRQVSSDGKLAHGGPYAVGCDIAGGVATQNASNSVLCAVDISTGEQVLEFAANDLDPIRFSHLAYVICKWLAGGRGEGWCVLNFETNYTSAFKNELKRLGYSNLYRDDKPNLPYKEKAKDVGCHNSDGGVAWLQAMQSAFRLREFLPRSEELVEECRAYEFDEDGKLLFKATEIKRATQGLPHGDRAIAASLAWLAAADRKKPKEAEERESQDLFSPMTVANRVDAKNWLRNFNVPSVLRN